VTDWSSSWVVLEWAAAALIAALVLPYFPSARRRNGGGAVRLVLALAAGLALAAATSEGTAIDAPRQVLHLGAILALVCGLIGLAGLVLFDLLLPALRVEVASVLRDAAVLGVAAIAVFVCLRLAGLDVLPLLTTSAVLTAVIGLALQTTIANVFGGLALHLDRTLGHGDWIETGTHGGRIVEIGWRATQLVTREGDTLFLPNSQLVSGDVLNLSRPTGAHRASVHVSVHERHAPGMVRAVLADAVRDAPGVLDYPPPDCVISDFGDSSVGYAVRYWLTEFERDAAIAGEVRSRLWYAARRAGLESPPPVLVGRRVDLAMPATAPAAAPEDAERRAVLRGVPLLAPLDAATLERLAAAMRRHEFTAGEVIVRQGAPGDSLYVVQRGEIGVRVEQGGSTAEMATLGPGQIFGEMSLLTGAPRTATCVARSEATCWVIDRAAFEPVLLERPEIAEHFSATLAARQTALDAHRDDLSAVSRSRLEADRQSRLLSSIRDLFGIGSRQQ
jgi:small-conductance mechanosensitive channel/CRP-like cAMP-binding protein